MSQWGTVYLHKELKNADILVCDFKVIWRRRELIPFFINEQATSNCRDCRRMLPHF